MDAPKVFVSYSWTTAGHQERVRHWAERLSGDGVEVILDVWDLKEGDDKYAFMEQMVTNDSVTHVLIFSDRRYAEKANERASGVGTESQIISQEIYTKVEQSKFIPIICERDEEDEPYLPAFLKSRVWVDFSTPEAANESWEQLIRLLYGRPSHVKPIVGKPPSYLHNDAAAPANPAVAKLQTLRQVVRQGRSAHIQRREFLEACVDHADSLRVRRRPDVDLLGERVLEDCEKLKDIRNLVAEWLLLEASPSQSDRIEEDLHWLLEQLLELKSRPADLNAWNDAWFEAHAVFVYETFLYIIAALVRRQAFEVLHGVFHASYLGPATSGQGVDRFVTFRAFYGYSDALQAVLAPEGKRLFSPAAEFIRRHADRDDLPFEKVMEAELLVLLNALVASDGWWYPQTLLYFEGWDPPEFFLRATRHRHFIELATITGIDEPEALREAARRGQERLGCDSWHDFRFARSWWELLNLEALNTLQ